MRILIQHCGDFRYFAGTDGWTAKPEEAEEFESTANALDRTLKQRLENVQIVMQFGSEELDVRLPLRSSGCAE